MNARARAEAKPCFFVGIWIQVQLDQKKTAVLGTAVTCLGTKHEVAVRAVAGKNGVGTLS
jgi:hypothetical protein